MTRQLGPFRNGVPMKTTAGLFHYLNTNKRGVSLNLEAPAGQQLFQRLLETADILMSDYAPSELERARPAV